MLKVALFPAFRVLNRYLKCPRHSEVTYALYVLEAKAVRFRSNIYIQLSQSIVSETK